MRTVEAEEEVRGGVGKTIKDEEEVDWEVMTNLRYVDSTTTLQTRKSGAEMYVMV